MRLARLTISNFQSFGKEPTTINLDDISYILGPNGAGKTAVLQALARMFATESGLRRVRSFDFHVPFEEASTPEERLLTIEADFEIPEYSNPKSTDPAIPLFAHHMGFTADDGIHRMCIRLEAILDPDGEVDEKISYVRPSAGADSAETLTELSRHDRAAIQVHYIPARRDPSDHISYAANSLVGRTLRSVKWSADEQEILSQFARGINWTLENNGAVGALAANLQTQWKTLHLGSYFSEPSVKFEQSDVDGLLRRLTVGFSPSPEGTTVEYTRLGDGQKSLLYISLVLAVHALGREVARDPLGSPYDIEKLRPAAYTMIAAEEPENSLAPRYLGKILKSLVGLSKSNDGQVIITTHSPALLRRVPPESIRFLRLDGNRETTIKTIILPAKAHDAHKYVREAVQAFPELYFARIVVLGEGDSEEVVLPRILAASRLAADDASIAVVPLGGRHVNHFWRLLHNLGIPHVTLLDLDIGRHQASWGRLKYAVDQLVAVSARVNGEKRPDDILLGGLPSWNTKIDATSKPQLKELLRYLEAFGVFYCLPIDLDFLMLKNFPESYGLTDLSVLAAPDEAVVRSVLGKSHGDYSVLSKDNLQLFGSYHDTFKVSSKPAAHISALSTIKDDDLIAGLPSVFVRLIGRVESLIQDLPE